MGLRHRAVPSLAREPQMMASRRAFASRAAASESRLPSGAPGRGTAREHSTA
eukprot:CAMPEP_0177625996 /NCGR_PEP_ID=MMETSP0419_2-20121207/30411_1 /TAXON_ID=582737 /ORGANISM="Tetraselmis sp., Strain GSL018" /LENGTH=51 /DNA_ID=CAMNT_0019127007 /DNA_START=422 /DNA_END=573 /DNA_ORIENTATION=-